MKICVISFDFWNYDAHIITALQERGIDAHHINLGAYKHKSIGHRLQNVFAKIFLKKNLKHINRQQLILDSLKVMGTFDQILVINPEQIDRKYHLKIKNYTTKYIAYLYDSLARNPAEHVLDLFDEIFSFDKNDCRKHGFRLITNYNYLAEKPYHKNPQFDLIYLASFDDRLKILYKILEKLDALGLNYKYFIVGKKTWKKQISGKTDKNRIYTRKRIQHDDIPQYYNEGKVLLDLVRKNQDGLSFRIFEAMALKKKIITNNTTISEYDFYNPQNILILKEDLSNIQKSFFESDYEELSADIYQKYTVNAWVETVFSL